MYFCSKEDIMSCIFVPKKTCHVFLSRSAMCDGKECPMADLRKIDPKYEGINSACYTGGIPAR